LRRGEVWTVSGGADYASKPRPAVIVQGDRFDATNSITICPMTSSDPSTRWARQSIQPSTLNGLARASRLMVDKITTVPKTKLRDQIGRLSDDEIARLNQALIVFLGLTTTGRASEPTKDVS
jgi:mRNA interferase MazF